MIHRVAKYFRASLKGPPFWREKKNYMREKERERERERERTQYERQEV